QVAGLGRAQEAEAVGQDFQHAVGGDALGGAGQHLEQGEDHVLLAGAGHGLGDAELLGDVEQLLRRHPLQVAQRVLRETLGDVGHRPALLRLVAVVVARQAVVAVAVAVAVATVAEAVAAVAVAAALALLLVAALALVAARVVAAVAALRLRGLLLGGRGGGGRLGGRLLLRDGFATGGFVRGGAGVGLGGALAHALFGGPAGVAPLGSGGGVGQVRFLARMRAPGMRAGKGMEQGRGAAAGRPEARRGAGPPKLAPRRPGSNRRRGGGSGVQSALSIIWLSWALPTAPIWVAWTWPSLNSSSIGIERTWYFIAVLRFWSMSTFTTLALPA